MPTWIKPRHASDGLSNLKLTPKMREVLEAADLEHGVINHVPIATMYALERLGLISDEWRRVPRGHTRQVTRGGSLPSYYDVKLTADGIRAARSSQGLRADL